MKNKLVLSLIISLLLVGCGKTTISESQLKEGLNKYLTSEYNDSECEATLNNGEMEVSCEDEKYTLTYNLKGNPTFTYETEVKEGISYDEYCSKEEGLTLPMLGYIASAYTFGVDIEDSATNFILTYFDGIMNYYDSAEQYIIVDDAEGLETDAEVILTSEFGSKVIDYVKASYAEDITIKDEENDTFTYVLSAKCEEKSCKFTAKLTINAEAQFEKLNGYADELAKEEMYEEITPETADYHIELKVGQTMKITGVNGYELSGMDVIEVDNEYDFKATKEGIANGYLYVGEDDQKSIYVTVTKAKENEELTDKSLNIQ